MVELLYVARVLAGLTYGLCYTVVPMYLGEIASDRIRGAVTIMLTVMLKSGVLLVYVIGRFATFRQIAWFNLIPAIGFMCTVYFLPETPYYLIGQHRVAEARHILQRLRGHSAVDAELDMMQEAVRKSRDNGHSILDLFRVRGNRRSLGIIVGLTSVQILCGSQSIVAYAETIFTSIGGGLDASAFSIVFAVVQLMAAVLSASVVDRIGRRPLLLFSVSGTTVCNFVVGLYFFLHRQEVDMTGMEWLPIAAIMVFIVCYVMGMATVIFALLGEIFPSNMKAIAGAAYMMTSSALSFSTLKLFQVVADGLGSDVAFGGFTVVGLLFLPFVWFVVPETKGKPLSVILEEMNAKDTWHQRQRKRN